MQWMHYRKYYCTVTIAWAFLNPASVPAQGILQELNAKLCSNGHFSNQRTIRDWFSQYDQIRRDAEMTTGDKWQSLHLNAKKPKPSNAALASRMMAKYETSLTDMKKLKSTGETRQLQDGYIEYFTTARQLFSDYLTAQEALPFTNQALIPTKKKLQELDRKNRRLDDDLRKKYKIARHKHS
ncbi:MAG: hypothetical protein K2Z81_02700 [Cyanobacteria bacterium]|nr:hypothetical protein [Cyanobacteriota bacterium]